MGKRDLPPPPAVESRPPNPRDMPCVAPTRGSRGCRFTAGHPPPQCSRLPPGLASASGLAKYRGGTSYISLRWPAGVSPNTSCRTKVACPLMRPHPTPTQSTTANGQTRSTVPCPLAAPVGMGATSAVVGVRCTRRMGVRQGSATRRVKPNGISHPAALGSSEVRVGTELCAQDYSRTRPHHHPDSEVGVVDARVQLNSARPGEWRPTRRWVPVRRSPGDSKMAARDPNSDRSWRFDPGPPPGRGGGADPCQGGRSEVLGAQNSKLPPQAARVSGPADPPAGVGDKILGLSRPVSRAT